jgi:hypothetical protein
MSQILDLRLIRRLIRSARKSEADPALIKECLLLVSQNIDNYEAPQKDDSDYNIDDASISQICDELQTQIPQEDSYAGPIRMDIGTIILIVQLVLRLIKLLR